MSQQPMKRYDPDLKYIGTGDYIPVMSPCNDGEYILAADVEAVLTDNARLRERLKDNVPIRFYRQDAHDIGEVMVQTHDGEFCRRTDLEAIQHALAAKEALLDSENVYHERLRQDLVEIINKVTSARDTLQAELAAVVGVLEQIRDLELDRPMLWEGPTAQWQHQQLALAQVMAAKAVNTLPASARALLDELAHERHQSEVYRVELGKACHAQSVAEGELARVTKAAQKLIKAVDDSHPDELPAKIFAAAKQAQLKHNLLRM